MQTFRYLMVLGVGTVLTLSTINRGIAQPQDRLPQNQQSDNYRRITSLSSEASSSTGSTHQLDRSSVINISQGNAPNTQLPPLAPGSPTPTPAPATPSPTPLPTPSPTPATPTPPPTISSPEELNRLNPSPNLLEIPTDPDEVRLPATSQPITLQQALELARRNNRDLQVAEVTLRRDRAALREAQAALLPTVTTQADLTRQGPGGSGGGNVFTDPTTGQSFSQGGSATTTALSGTIQATYDIYTSGSRPATIRRQEEQVRFSELEVERLTEQLRLDVSNDYYDVQEADEQVRINRAAVDNSRASLRDAQALERAGLGTRFDVLQAQVQLANDTQTLTQAFSQQRIARRQLSQRLSLGSSADVSAADPVAVAARWNRSLEESTVLAFQNRAELGQQLAQRNISEQNRRIALAALGPQVSIVASYTGQNIFENDQEGGFTGFTDNYAIGPQVTLNIFEGGAARARAAQEEANIRIAETNFANTRNQVRFAVEQAFFNLNSSFTNIQTASVAVEQARESLRLARLRFQAGVGIQSDVLDAVAALTEAEGNRVTAILGYNRALVSLQREISNLQVTAP